jgi:hypothetical protein
MEHLDKEVGASGDPLLNALRGAVITDAAKRTTLDHYLLQKRSTLLHAGLNLQALAQISPDDHDFWGNPLSRDTPPTVGAHAGSQPHP